MSAERNGCEQSRLRVVNWNIEWKTATSKKGREIKDRIAALNPDVICVTEGHTDFFDGHIVTSEADYGLGVHSTKRKVVLWSASPWTDVDVGATVGLPSGRFVGASTQTPLGEVRFLGVCIPWRFANVKRGRKVWEDHETYLEGLPRTAQFGSRRRLVLLGDFNQTIPRTRAPHRLFSKLESAISSFRVATKGDLPSAPFRSIDHVCHSEDLLCSPVAMLHKEHTRLGQLTDHNGIYAEFQLR